MAGEMYVQSSQALQDIIEDLTKWNSEFLNRVEDLKAEAKTLTSKWEGDASTEFNTTFTKESVSYTEFSDLVKTHISALSEMKVIIEEAEDECKRISTH